MLNLWANWGRSISNSFRSRWTSPEPRLTQIADKFRQLGERAVGWLSGSCLLVRRTAFSEIGGFDERYFMYMEDVDLGDRLGRAGWQNVYAPSAEILHAKGHSTGRDPARNLAAHHRSTWTYLSDRHTGAARAPLRWAMRGALAVRSGLVVAKSRREQKREMRRGSR